MGAISLGAADISDPSVGATRTMFVFSRYMSEREYTQDTAPAGLCCCAQSRQAMHTVSADQFNPYDISTQIAQDHSNLWANDQLETSTTLIFLRKFTSQAPTYRYIKGFPKTAPKPRS